MITKEKDFISYLNKIEMEYEAISHDEQLALWKQYLGKKAANYQKISQRMFNLLSDVQLSSELNFWENKVSDNIIKHKIRILKNEILSVKISKDKDVSALEDRIKNKIIAFKPQVDGKTYSRSDINEILSKSPDRDLRKKAYLSISKLAKDIESETKELIILRNKKVRFYGFNDYATFAFEISQIKKEQVVQICDGILSSTEDIWKNILDIISDKLKTDKIYPWDMSYFGELKTGQSLDEYFKKDNILPSFEKMINGYSLSLKNLPIEIKYYDIPYGGLCFAFNNGKDIKILANPNDGHKWYKTLYHELGHALHHYYSSDLSFLVANGDPSFFVEGLACIIQNITYERAWLKQMNIPDNLINDFLYNQFLSKIIYLRSLVQSSLFELSLYENPSGDLNKIYFEHATKISKISLPEEPIWASSSFYVSYPIYIQNYILADIIADQTCGFLKGKYGSMMQKEAFDCLNEKYYKVGALLSWNEKIKNLTGKNLEI